MIINEKRTDINIYLIARRDINGTTKKKMVKSKNTFKKINLEKRTTNIGNMSTLS